MTPNDIIEGLVKSMQVKPTRQAHYETLEAMRQAYRNNSKLWSLNLAAKLAASVAIVVVILLIAYITVTPRAANKPEFATSRAPTAKTLCEMLTVRSMQSAFDRGDMDALDALFKRANELAGPRPVGLSARELLADIGI